MDPIATSQTAGAVLNTIKDVVKYAVKASGNVAYTDVSKSLRVEPIVIISQDLTNTEFMPDVMQSVQNLFVGYYLQAISLIGNINTVKAIKVLDKLNPNSSVANKSWMYGFENYKFKLPSVKVPQVTLESFGNENYTAKVFEKDINTRINENASLSVGKIFNVSLKVPINADKVEDVTVPVSVRLMVNQVSEKAIVSMLTMMSRDTTFKERWHAYRAGKISFIKDLVLCNDLIKDAKRVMQNDKDGVITQIFQRSTNSKLNSLFGSSGLNLASATNIYVISKEVADAIEAKLTSKLSNFKTREELLKSGYCMILAVVDKTWERVTFYHRGIAASSSVGIKDIKASNKGNGPDVTEIMKAILIGNQPPI